MAISATNVKRATILSLVIPPCKLSSIDQKMCIVKKIFIKNIEIKLNYKNINA